MADSNGNSRDQAGQLINAPSLPPSGAPVTIIGGNGNNIPGTMVGGTAVPNKSN